MRAGLLAIVILIAQAMPRDTAAPTASGSAVIRGRVVIAGTNIPVPRAIVTLGGTPGNRVAPRTVYANGDGRFEFGGLAAGSYGVSARPNQYQLQFLPSADRTEATALDGQITDGIEVGLLRAAVIAGRVVDEFGQPMGGVLVFPNRVADRPGMSGTSSTTDENGRYRLNHLTPGSYYIVARPAGRGDFGVDAASDYLETYHPGAAARADALRVQVRAGEEIDAGDMHVLRGKTLRVRGIVTDSQGKLAPPNRTSVMLAYSAGAEGRSVDAQGGFDFGRRAAGKYRLSAAIRSESDEGVAEFVDVALTLDDVDADTIVLATVPAARLTGRVIFEEVAAPAAGTMAIRAQAIDRRVGGGLVRPETAPVTEDMSFTFARVAGERLLRLESPPPANVLLKAVMRGNEDITNIPTLFSSGDTVRIVLTSHASKMEGTVTLDGVRPAASHDVIVFPEDRRAWVSWSTAVQRARTDARGHYVSPPLPAGRYYVVAVPIARSVLPTDVDPAILESLVPEASTVTIGADEIRGVDLRVASGGGH